MQEISNSHRAERCSAMFVSVACWPHHHRALGNCCVHSSACRSADADLTLLSKRAPPPHAWRGKVVWIVGASQVGLLCIVPKHVPASCKRVPKLQVGSWMLRRVCEQACTLNSSIRPATLLYYPTARGIAGARRGAGSLLGGSRRPPHPLLPLPGQAGGKQEGGWWGLWHVLGCALRHGEGEHPSILRPTSQAMAVRVQ